MQYSSAMLVLFFMVVANLDVGLCQTCSLGNCKKTVGNFVVQYSSFTKVTDMKFASWTANETISVTGTQEERERSCAKKCMNNGPAVCKAADLSPYQDGIASTCQLFNQNSYEHKSSQLANIRSSSSGYTSFHLFNSFCAKHSCKNDGICRPDFSTDNGVCECIGYSGKLCEKFDPFHHKEAGYWDFEDHSLRNTALGASTIGNGANYHGVITTAPDRKGKVMQCSGTQWNVDCFAAPVATSLNTPCLTGFASQPYCPSGFTYGFWTRMFDIVGSSDTLFHYLVSQTHDTDSTGFVISYQRSPGITLTLEFSTAYRLCNFKENIKIPTRGWVFIGLTYDPSTTKSYCFYNEDYKEMSVSGLAQGPPARALAFAGNGPFFVDNIFYFPKYSTAAEVSAIYDLTKE